ncbi:MAG: hypothetical protein JWO71_1218 [Candidatus Acidoferrum typicum]|nr:hypothetical protein [Candidatus Acidoferrum typicum]
MPCFGTTSRFSASSASNDAKSNGSARAKAYPPLPLFPDLLIPQGLRWISLDLHILNGLEAYRGRALVYLDEGRARPSE